MRMTKTAALAAVAVLALAGCKATTNTSGNAAASNTTTENTTTTTSAAAGTIDGTWKGDVNSVKFEQKPDEFLLQNGKYDCKSCIPPVSLAADGAYHPVANHAYYDAESVKVVDPNTVQTSTKLKGRETGHSTMTVSSDGKTLKIDWTDTSVANAKPNTGSFEETRAAAGPAGSHAISGSWTPSKIASVNQEAITLTRNADADQGRSGGRDRIGEEAGRQQLPGNRHSRREGRERDDVHARIRRQADARL
jgi:hypothetical protein